MSDPAQSVHPPQVAACVRVLAEACDQALAAVIFFGSRLVNTTPDRHSAADLFVVVEDYARAYRGLRAAGIVRRPPWLLAATNRWLPPNVLRVLASEDSAGGKCFFISRRDLERELGPQSRDHFCKGRLTQIVRVVHARDSHTHEWLDLLLENARRDSLRWVPAYLPPRFDAREYCRAMMSQSYRSEIRPEASDRVLEVLAAQGEGLIRLYDAMLRREGASWRVLPVAEGFERDANWRRRDGYFLQSRIRATLRWAKYVITFENWLDYIVQKLHRRSAVEIELTPWERRLPWLLLWPKFLRVLWQLRRGAPPPTDPRSSHEERPE